MTGKCVSNVCDIDNMGLSNCAFKAHANYTEIAIYCKSVGMLRYQQIDEQMLP